jgi:hypothetical protein
MKTYSVYIKSHCEQPDYEDNFTEVELKGRRCLIPYADDVEKDEDGHISVYHSKCAGKLVPLPTSGFRCTDCGAFYEEI